jgi:hypothetical protein
MISKENTTMTPSFAKLSLNYKKTLRKKPPAPKVEVPMKKDKLEPKRKTFLAEVGIDKKIDMKYCLLTKRNNFKSETIKNYLKKEFSDK